LIHVKCVPVCFIHKLDANDTLKSSSYLFGKETSAA
jgi:hypothetical protein